MESGRTDEAVELLRCLVSEYPNEPFPAMAFRQEQKRQLVEDANDLLCELRLNQLVQLIREAERRGEACPELLAFTQVKDALDTLRLFVSKMPWVTSASLRKNLELLDQHRGILERSSDYKAFRAAQDAEVVRLEQLERRQAFERAVIALDRSLISGQGLREATMLRQELFQSQRGNYLERCYQAGTVEALRALWQEGLSDRMNRCAFEVSVLHRWEVFGSVARKAISRMFSEQGTASLSGGWLAVCLGVGKESVEEFVQRVLSSEPACVPSQGIIRRLLESNILPNVHYSAWCWRSPCPGATEILARLKQVGQRQSVVKQR